MNGEKLNQIAASNAAQALQGRVAGVLMTQTSTQPGAEMQIRIREVYPEKNMVGNDTQVLIVCDQAYRQYASWGYSGETMCIVKLYKVLRCGTLIKERRCMNAYNM